MSNKITSKFLRALEYTKYGSIHVELPNGNDYKFEGTQKGPKAHFKMIDTNVIANMLTRGDVGLVEDYRTKKWDTHNIVTLIEFTLRNETKFRNYLQPNALNLALLRLSYLLRANTRRGSKRNIHAHYDLGNEFYKLWLDPSMTYSSAMFKNKKETLFDAQQNKYDRILERIGDKTQKILEIGCGWGGFAERAASKAAHHIDGITISNEQFQYAKNRLKNLKDNANIHMRDYRDINGKYDAIVSIEMFEAVGERYWKTYFAKIKSLLAEGGKAVIQTITIDDERFDDYRKGTDIIRSYIFPGGMLPSVKRFTEEAARAGLKINDSFTFGQSYAKTLLQWLDRFDTKTDDIQKLNFDESFIRLWRFYLAACSSSFKVENNNVMQIELKHDN